MSGTRRNWLWILPALAGVIGLLALLTVSTGPGAGRVSLQPAPRSDGDGDQVIFRKEVTEDRKSLFDGVLSYLPPQTVDVGDTLEFPARLMAIASDAPPDSVPGRVVARRSLRVGGVQKAYLSEPGKDVADSPAPGAQRTTRSPDD
ncbi:hypothetical protein [Streptomyces sp. cmx-4-9]|uniref:hypothetical protein n=1 Tax=Streptomyces sp. cmx-4-9 TaxID=2790941 RepID=UPI00398022A5